MFELLDNYMAHVEKIPSIFITVYNPSDSPIKNPPFMGGFFIGDSQLELELAGSEFDNKREAHGGVLVSNILRTNAVATQAIYGAE